MVRALINGQFESLRKNYYLTDDYAWDAAVNFQEGEIADVINFVEKIVEDPSGWRAYRDGGTVSISCHSFDSNKFVPKIEPPFRKGAQLKEKQA